LSQHSRQRLNANNFDLLRLLFAGTVCLVHAYQLSGYQQLEWIERILSSAVAVKAFFVVSGFLIFMSFERSPSISSYAGKRFRRIYPAYFTVVMLCAIGLLGASSKSIGDYFSPAWIKYVLANLSFLNFLHPTLPGVFETNKVPAVNGALWTLKIEVLFYFSVPLFVFLFRRFGYLSVMVIVYALSVAYAMLFSWIAERTGAGSYLELGRQLPGQLSYFMAGAFFYYYLPFFERHARYFVLGALPLLAANMHWPLLLIEPFALAAVVVFFALFPYVGNFGKYGDFSYGVYILHFPIIQCFIHFGWLASRPWLFLTAIVLTTAMAAIAIWHVVEKRFLLRNSHYVAASPAVSANAAR
jgi:peptidoglycan/LPS O-acetylase OafA/YrhL